MASEKTESYNARGGSSNVTQERKNKADVHGGVKTPPYIPGYTVVFPANPARPFTPAGRHICLPYKHPVPRTRTQKRCNKANTHGPHTCGPYKPGQTGSRPGTSAPLFLRGRRPRFHLNFSFFIFHFFHFSPRTVWMYCRGVWLYSALKAR